MESIDDLLAQVKAEYQGKQVQKPKKVPLFEEELNSAEVFINQSKPSSKNWNSPAEESLLAQVKTEFAEKQRTEELKNQQKIREEAIKKEQEIQEEQIKVEQREKRKRELLTQEAFEWLKTLNTRSDEGRWFEEFSCSYSSKLEAAIEYLQALKETYR